MMKMKNSGAMIIEWLLCIGIVVILGMLCAGKFSAAKSPETALAAEASPAIASSSFAKIRDRLVCEYEANGQPTQPTAELEAIASEMLRLESLGITRISSSHECVRPYVLWTMKEVAEIHRKQIAIESELIEIKKMLAEKGK